MDHIFQTSVLFILVIQYIIELNWLCKHIKKVRSSQPAIFVLNWIKHSFPCGYRYKFRRIQIIAPEICNSDKKRLHCRCFPENFPNCLRIIFLQNTSGRLLLDIFIHLTTFLAIQWTNRNQAFHICEHDLSRLSSEMNIMSFAFGKLCETNDPPKQPFAYVFQNRCS